MLCYVHNVHFTISFNNTYLTKRKFIKSFKQKQTKIKNRIIIFHLQINDDNIKKKKKTCFLNLIGLSIHFDLSTDSLSLLFFSRRGVE